MKFMVCTLLALVATAAASAAADPSGSAPVDRIVKLLQTMSTTVTRDGEQEAKAYNKHACWCETTSKKKALDIEAANADMRTFGQRVLKLKGQVAVAAGRLEENAGLMTDTQQQIAERTTIRTKQNTEYQAESAETKEAMNALEKAITMLADATSAKTALLQSASATQSRSAVADMLGKLPYSIHALKEDHLMLLSEFAGSSTGYSPQSATIQGILGDMYATFAKTLEESTELEAKRNGDFETSDAVDTKAIATLTTQREETSASKAQSQAMLAETTSAYDDTQKQLQADIAFFDVTKKECVSEHSKWTIRTAARTTELTGLKQALAILTSDENRALFDKSIKPGTERTSFLQIDSTPALLQDGAAHAVAKAYGALKTQVKKENSLRLAALAVQVRTAKHGHFDVVIASITGMMKTLSDEGTADKAKKTQCQKEYQNNTKATKDLSWKIEVSDAKITKFESLIEIRTAEKAVAVKQIQETNDAIATMVRDRGTANEAFKQSVIDDETAITVLGSAKKELTDRAVVTRDAGASNTILTVFEAIIEDLHNEIKSGKQNEADAMREHIEAKALADKVVEDLTQKKVTLSGMIAKRGEDKEDEVTTKSENSGALTKKQEWKAEIKPDCDWIIKNIAGRAAARSSEMEGLQQAKAFLSGQTALISKKARFLGMH